MCRTASDKEGAAPEVPRKPRLAVSATKQCVQADMLELPARPRHLHAGHSRGFGIRRNAEMECITEVDFAALEASAARWSQELTAEDLTKHCMVHIVKTPPGGGSPEGLHTHVVDQIFYILRGKMNIEIQGAEHTSGPGTLVVFLAGVPHRNWNAGTEATVHLSIVAPPSPKNIPFASTVRR